MPRTACILMAWILAVAMASAADVVEKISLPTSTEIQRADLYYWKEIRRPQAVLILCPGYNGNGEGLIRQKIWQEFAKTHRLGLVGLSFASKGDPHTGGYYYASQGSGELLLTGIRKIYGRELPLVLYGFSGGAHFTSRFEEWKPEQVVTWCAYSAGWWNEPLSSQNCPPGIVICGDEDARFGASLIYFKQGRAIGKPWLWISVSKTGHSPLPTVENFIRSYFHVILEEKNAAGLWVDIDKKAKADSKDVKKVPSVTAWLPDKALLDNWKEIHEP